ncbi:MAG: hypothetical protein CMO80_13685 [Verrucomicrobiales bacterium]|nr:hypothetical protein [Verrucomicrobiales bacterium]|tara:strand:+ start:1960 stop:2169 length:210 start_codon:yes stop_codon:yes gene_type:complete
MNRFILPLVALWFVLPKSLCGQAERSRLSEMKDLLEKIITRGRSSPGKPQNNDVKVVRHPKKPVKRSKK